MSDNTPADVMSQRATAAGITLIAAADAAAGATVRVAIELAAGGQAPVMEILKHQNPLVNIIADLCKKWKLDDSTSYQLQFDDKKVSPPPIYITEENRDKINNGDILKLDFSPQKMSQILAVEFQKNTISKGSVDRLAQLSTDITFVERFVAQGFSELRKFIIDVAKLGQLSVKSGAALSAFAEIMDHSIVSWETVNEEFIDSVLWYVQAKHESDKLVLKSALNILDSAIQNSRVGKNFVMESKIDVNHFISTLKTRNDEVQTLCISLVNTILSNSISKKQEIIRKQLLSLPLRQLIWESIFTAPVGLHLGFQLYVLQTHLFNLLSDRLHGAISTRDVAALKEVTELCQIAFDEGGDLTGISKQQARAKDSRDYTKLGFKNPTEPLLEFKQAPPGSLALDCMAFFAHQYTQQYRQVVLENSRERADEQDCPFAQASVELTKLLSNILKIGVPPSDQPGKDNRTYHPMFFFKEKPFEECFCVCIQRLTKTWKEMKASLSDFSKVLMVVKEQITRALSEKPHTFDSLKTKLTNWSYARIQEVRQKELEEREELKRQAKPILELREMIKPEIQEVIRQQRINRMVSGMRFKTNVKAAKTRNEKFMHCRLSQNAKVLHYGLVGAEQTIPETQQSINILDIEDVRDCEDLKGRAKSIVIAKQGGEELQLIAEDPKDHEMWLDGLHSLTGKPISGQQAQIELDELLSMEVKLRLLDAEGINFPEKPPPVPAPPTNFKFVTV